MKILLIALFLIFSLSSCASTVSKKSLHPISGKSIKFAKEFIYDISNDFDLPKPKPGSFRGVRAGTYISEYEDDNGIYYRGTGFCIYWGGDNPKTGKPSLVPGGIRISKDLKTFRLYYYQSDLTGGFKGVPDQAATAANPAATSSTGGVIGSAVGTGVVEAIIALGNNDIVFFPRPPSGISISDRFVVVPYKLQQ